MLSIFQRQMILLIQLQEDMEQELNHKPIQITILTIHPARLHSEQASLILKNTQVQFIDQEIHNKNSQTKEP